MLKSQLEPDVLELGSLPISLSFSLSILFIFYRFSFFFSVTPQAEHNELFPGLWLPFLCVHPQKPNCHFPLFHRASVRKFSKQVRSRKASFSLCRCLDNYSTVCVCVCSPTHMCTAYSLIPSLSLSGFTPIFSPKLNGFSFLSTCYFNEKI